MLCENRFRLLFIPIVALLLTFALRLDVASAQTQSSERPGDASAGLRLAKMWCSECHAVERGSPNVNLRAPDFAAVAERASTTALSLNVFLRSTHDTMPNVILKQHDADDIVAYILSLAAK